MDALAVRFSALTLAGKSAAAQPPHPHAKSDRGSARYADDGKRAGIAGRASGVTEGAEDAEAAFMGFVVAPPSGLAYSVAVETALDGAKGWRFPCPRCGGNIEMKEAELNCKIVRHGDRLGPHADQAACEQFARDSLQRFRGGAGCGAALQFREGLVLQVDHST
jgi:hypothetical protein